MYELVQPLNVEDGGDSLIENPAYLTTSQVTQEQSGQEQKEEEGYETMAPSLQTYKGNK